MNNEVTPEPDLVSPDFEELAATLLEQPGPRLKEAMDKSASMRKPAGRPVVLTPKMLKFVEEMLVDMDPQRACVRAGYASKNPKEAAYKLMKHPLVKAHLESRMGERTERLDLTADFVIMKLMSIVQKTEKENPTAALRGLELLGKHLGMYRDRQEISGPDGAAIQMQEKVTQSAADFTSRISSLADRARAGIVVVGTNTGSAG